jgi:hypothetical protein
MSYIVIFYLVFFKKKKKITYNIITSKIYFILFLKKIKSSCTKKVTALSSYIVSWILFY